MSFFTKPLFIHLLVLYVTFLVCAFATASKLVALPFGLSASISTVTCYAFCFVITDIVSELYGYKASRVLIRYGIGSVCCALFIFQVAVAAPSADGFDTQDGFAQTLGYPYRIIIGGLVGYILSQQVDIFIYHRLKVATQGRFMWLRNNVSTFCAQAVDSCVWITIAFAGTVPDLITLISGEYIVKLVIAFLDTIILYIVVKWSVFEINTKIVKLQNSLSY